MAEEPDFSDLTRLEEEFLSSNLYDFRREDNYCYGYIDGTAADKNDLIERFMALSSSSFVRSTIHDKVQGHKRFSSSVAVVFQQQAGNVRIPFFGHPFSVIVNETRKCVHGDEKDSRGGFKSRKSDKDDSIKRGYLQVHGSKKLGCTASIQVRTARVYTDFIIEGSITGKKATKKEKQRIIKEVQQSWESGKELNLVNRHFFRMPLSLDHTMHPIGKSSTVCNKRVDKRVVEKIHQVVGCNVTNPTVVSDCIENFVENELFKDVENKPSKSNRRFHPSREDLKKHIAKGVCLTHKPTDDQESLNTKIDHWKKSTPSTKFFLRTCHEISPEQGSSKFLFVHQEEWQRSLMIRYGSDLVLMDATHKATKYAIPLFVICVHTNVGYKVVAEFMCQEDDPQSIGEALAILHQWNPSWEPKYFMIDFSAPEIVAINSTFPNTLVYISDFHRVQSWKRWIAEQDYLSKDQQEHFLRMMKAIANAQSETAYQDSVKVLERSDLFQHYQRICDFCKETWLPYSSQWARAFRDKQASSIVNINNGIERQKHLFKYTCLPRSLDTVCGIAMVLIESFIPDSYQDYLEANLKGSSCYRRYNDKVPSYLHDRPFHFVKHCLKSFASSQDLNGTNIICISVEKGEFLVPCGKGSSKFVHLCLKEPSCECDDWMRTYYPCKHMYAAFQLHNEWDFTKLPDAYKNSVFITIDQSLFERDVRLGKDSNIPKNNLSSTINTARPGTKALKLRHVIQNKIDELKSLALQVYDEDVLQSATDEVDAIINKLNEHCPKQSGHPVHQNPMKKRLKLESEVDEADAAVLSVKGEYVNNTHLFPQTEESLMSIAEVCANLERFDTATILSSSQIEPVTKPRETMLKIGPFKLTLLDMWTILRPGQLTSAKVKELKLDPLTKDFKEGWLADTVIDSVLWQLALKNDSIFVADTTMCQVIQADASTKMLLKGECFDHIEKIIIPVNENKEHWTLFVIDKKEKVRIYLDPIQGNLAPNVINAQSNPSLFKLLNELSQVTDKKTGWNSVEWKCIEPSHCMQTDGFNCGVFVCAYAKSICNGVDLNSHINVNSERQSILKDLLGHCYSDLLQKRNTNLCKKCKNDDKKDMVACDKCGQGFHIRCIDSIAYDLSNDLFYCH